MSIDSNEHDCATIDELTGADAEKAVINCIDLWIEDDEHRYGYAQVCYQSAVDEVMPRKGKFSLGRVHCPEWILKAAIYKWCKDELLGWIEWENVWFDEDLNPDI